MTAMNDTDVILRYLYLGTDQPFYIRKNQSLDIKEGCRILSPIQNLIDATSLTSIEGVNAQKLAKAVNLTEHPVDMVVRVMKTGALVRNDECLFTLAYLARNFQSPEERHKVYEVVPTLIENSNDLFQFLHFYQTLATKPAGKGLGNGIRNAIAKWYDKHSAEQLAELLAMDPGSYHWSHKDIIMLAHIKLEDDAKMQLLDAVVGGPGRKRPSKPKADSKQKSTDDGSEKKESEGTELNNTVVEKVEDCPKKEQQPEVDNTEQPEQEDSEALKVYKRIKTFKSVKTAAEACPCIKAYNYPIQLVPSHLHRAPIVWESLFPHMSYREIVNAALVLHDYKLIKENDSQISITYGNFLNRMTSVSESKIHPIFIYQTMRLFEERQRYLNVVKEAVHTTNNLALKTTKPNTSVMNQFYKALNESMLNHQRTGLNFFVTLDLRSKQSKKRVFGNRLMSCQAAYVLLTLPLLKRETHVKVFSFAEDPNVLDKVSFTREMTFFQGCDYIQEIAKKKTKSSITQPINYAQQNKMKVDVFITIVDSLVRVNPKRESPVSALNIYNTETKKKACYIIVSLSRHQRDLNHVNVASTRGVLELVGCSEDTPKVIDAYVKRHFA